MMKKIIRKFISLFFLVVFFLGSGAGQLIHAHFHNHDYKIQSTKTSALNTPHNYCCALQLTLPEFFESSGLFIQHIKIFANLLFTNPEPSIPHLYTFKTSDRAPPSLA